MKFLRILAAGALALVFFAAGPVLAQSPPASTTVDFAPWIKSAFELSIPFLAAGVLWLVKRYIGAQTSDRDKALLEDLMRNGLALLQARYGKNAVVDVGSASLATALGYVQAHGPEVLKRVGISLPQLEEKLVARWFDPSVPVGVTEKATDPKPGPVSTAG